MDSPTIFRHVQALAHGRWLWMPKPLETSTYRHPYAFFFDGDYALYAYDDEADLLFVVAEPWEFPDWRRNLEMDDEDWALLDQATGNRTGQRRRSV